MDTRLSDSKLYKLNGIFYPRGHVFAMVPDLETARAVAAGLRALDGSGEAEALSSSAILEHMAERADQVGGMPSVGRERQFMLRFVELAREGLCGVLADVDKADPDAIADLLATQAVDAAYYYRALVIEELADSSKRARDAAAGEL